MSPTGPSAFNEAIAWLFLRAAGVPTPKNSALLILSERKAIQILGRSHLEPKKVLNGFVLSWVTQQLDFSSIRALFAGSAGDEKLLQMLKTTTGTAIAAFDEAFLNLDRNSGNILFYDRNSCVAIDHECCFGQQDWIAGELQQMEEMQGDSMRVIGRAFQGKKLDLQSLERIKNHVVLHGQKHARALAECRHLIEEVLLKAFPDEAEVLTHRVMSFITLRTTDRWMENKLGVM